MEPGNILPIISREDKKGQVVNLRAAHRLQGFAS
jgi:hypothetical protein